MLRAGVRSGLHGLSGEAASSLRVVALTYAGLGGVLALALLVSVSVLPVAPVLQQATEPARQIVGALSQPSPGGMGSFISGGPGFTWQPPRAVPATVLPADGIVFGPAATGESATPDRVAEPELEVVPDAEDSEPVAEPEAPIHVVPVRAYVPRVVAVARVELPVAVEPEEDVADEPDPAPAVSAPMPTEIVVVQPAEREVLRVASEAPPKALPPVPTPTDTPQQAKARADLQNQAAIDAAKTAQARAKADADDANQTAISARQASEAAAAQEADGANQAAIDATKVAKPGGAPPTPTATPPVKDAKL
jgi:hypothetical protein